MESLTAISPIDGRYRDKVDSLAEYFSEYALIKYRVKVEIEYFITLCELPLPQLIKFDHEYFEDLRKIYKNFSVKEAKNVKINVEVPDLVPSNVAVDSYTAEISEEFEFDILSGDWRIPDA